MADPADIITLSEFKAAIGESGTSNDPRYAWAITAASTAARSFTDRTWGIPAVTETREFEYEGLGILDIPDCTNITAVTVKGQPAGVADVPLTVDQWRAEPHQAPVYYYLIIPGGGWLGGSPEMGFRQNLDVYAREGRFSFLPSIVTVAATWGWPTIPADVKQAITIMVSSLSEESTSLHTSESIESYSYSDGGGGNMTARDAIPQTAVQLLWPYLRDPA